MASLNVNNRELDKRTMKDFDNQDWLVKKHNKNIKNKSSTSYNFVVPPLKLIRPNHSSTTKQNSSSKLEQYQQNLDKAIDKYKTIKEAQQAPIRSHLPVPPPPERIRYTHLAREDDHKISKKVVSVGTNTDLTLTKDDMEIFAFLKNADVHMDDVQKAVNDRKDNNNNENLSIVEEDKASLENIREALFESSNNNKKKLLPILTYLSVDNHDCENSVLCSSEDKGNKSSSNGETYQCIFKTLKDTLTPDHFQKVRKHLQDHIFGVTSKNGECVARKKTVMNKYRKPTGKVEKKKNCIVAVSDKAVYANAENQQSQNNINETPSANLNANEIFVPIDVDRNMTPALPAITNFPADQHVLYNMSKLRDPRNKPMVVHPPQQVTAQQGVQHAGYMTPMPQVWIPHQATPVPYPIPSPGYHHRTNTLAPHYRQNQYSHCNIAYPNASWNNSVYMKYGDN